MTIKRCHHFQRTPDFNRHLLNCNRTHLNPFIPQTWNVRWVSARSGLSHCYEVFRLRAGMDVPVVPQDGGCGATGQWQGRSWLWSAATEGKCSSAAPQGLRCAMRDALLTHSSGLVWHSLYLAEQHVPFVSYGLAWLCSAFWERAAG